MDVEPRDIEFERNAKGDPIPFEERWNPPQVPLTALKPVYRPIQPNSGLWGRWTAAVVWVAALLVSVGIAISWFVPGDPGPAVVPTPPPPSPYTGSVPDRGVAPSLGGMVG